MFENAKSLIAAIVISSGSLYAANAVNALPEFIGAALGAFVYQLARNEKRKVKLIIDRAILEHEKSMHVFIHNEEDETRAVIRRERG
jgi:hypothetical protein